MLSESARHSPKQGRGVMLSRYSRLVASDTTTPVSSKLLRLLEVVCLGSGDEVGEGLRVLGSDVGDSDGGGGLLA